MELNIPTIVIVEDDPMLQEMYADVCNQLGLAYRQITDGTEAYDFFKHGDTKTVRAVILDYMLPGVSGQAILDELKKDPTHWPVIVVSAIAEQSGDLSDLGPGKVVELVKGEVSLKKILLAAQAIMKPGVATV